MNGRTLLGVAMVVAGVGIAIFGGYQAATGGGPSGGTATGSPQATPGPTATPGAAATTTPTATPTPEPTVTPEPTATPAPTVGAETDAAIRAFLIDLVAAIRAGDVEVMAARLNGATIDRYGASACEARLASDQADATYAIEITDIHPLGPWEYVTDDRTTTIDEAWTIDADVKAQGQTQRRELHLAPMDGGVSWFSDCGDPLPVP